MKKRKIALLLSVVILFIFLSLYIVGYTYFECDNLVWGEYTCGGSNYCYANYLEEHNPICWFKCMTETGPEYLECFPIGK